MILGVVGNGADKFTARTAALAKFAIVDATIRYGAHRLVSGHSPMGGVDIWAEEIAELFGLQMTVHAPESQSWAGINGYRDRNLRIARDSELVLCVVAAELPPGYVGRRFPFCYHCKGRNEQHVKSGGCWTAWKARKREWRIVE